MDECHVYTLSDAAGQVLYVGVTKDVDLRVQQHHADKPWAYQIASVTTEDGLTRREALARERKLINALQPLHNTHHLRDVPPRDRSTLKKTKAFSLATPVALALEEEARRRRDKNQSSIVEDALIEYLTRRGLYPLVDSDPTLAQPTPLRRRNSRYHMEA